MTTYIFFIKTQKTQKPYHILLNGKLAHITFFYCRLELLYNNLTSPSHDCRRKWYKASPKAVPMMRKVTEQTMINFMFAFFSICLFIVWIQIKYYLLLIQSDLRMLIFFLLLEWNSKPLLGQNKHQIHSKFKIYILLTWFKIICLNFPYCPPYLL